MKLLKKILKVITILIVTLLLIVMIGDACWILIPQVKAQKDIVGLSDISHDIDDIVVNKDAKIIALGEATHGNVEFQQLKLSVLKVLVEKYGVRAFALETDFGEGLDINDYIQGEDNFVDDISAIKSLSFNIYHTDQMVELVNWMRSYNATVEKDKQLFFFGFDLQNPAAGLTRLLTYVKENGLLPEIEINDIEKYIKGEFSIVDEQGKNVLASLQKVSEALDNSKNNEQALVLKRVITCVVNHKECLIEGGAANYIRYNNKRDEYMAQNVEWIVQYLASYNCEAIMLAGHNGHVAYKQQFYTTMGENLRKIYGNQFFVIGTDYYHTTCNINVAGPDSTRNDYKFCSGDILARNSQSFGGSYYLNFAEANAQDSQAKQIINSKQYMGCLGEGYTWSMHVLPMAQRVNEVPTELYDAMILFYETSPIRVIK